MKTLKNVLLINALSSGATGLILATMPGFMAELFSSSQSSPFVAVGIFLIFFAIMVFTVSRQNSVNIGALRLIVILDSLWVIVSLIVITVGAFDLSTVGYLLIGGVALWVALMAYLQFNGLKKITA